MSASHHDVILVGQGLVSAYGRGVECCAEALLAGQCAIRPATERAFPESLSRWPIAAVPAASGPQPRDRSRFLTLLRDAVSELPAIPDDTEVFLATTVGMIDTLEQAVLTDTGLTGEEALSALPQHLAERFGVPPSHIHVVSSACTSSTSAVALAASALRHNDCSCALVVGCDIVSEFVLSGFAALMAMDPDGAHPFDANRKGVTLGEAAACALLMRRDRAEREARPNLGIVCGWAMTCDANHLTGPSRDGAPLAEAINAALAMTASPASRVTAICAHGTGTLYNDQMEMLAFKQVFGNQPRPTFSVKGGMGHTLGAAGVAEMLLSLDFLRRGRLPPTTGLRTLAPEAEGWVSRSAAPLPPDSVVLSTNSGFGGTNAALVLALKPLAGPPPADPSIRTVGEGYLPMDEEPSAFATPFAPPRNFGRFCTTAQRAFHVVAQALTAAGIVPDEQGYPCLTDDATRLRIAIVATDREGSNPSNLAYFSDYVKSGRQLGRGHLFVYTLPSSVAAECAIACRLTGPLLYVAETAPSVIKAEKVARFLLADAQPDAVVILAATGEDTRARVITASLTKDLPKGITHP